MSAAHVAHAVAHVRVMRAMGATKRTPGRVPKQLMPTGIERAYGVEIRALVVPVIRAAFAPLLAAMPAILTAAARDVRLDADEGKRIAEFTEAARKQIGSSIPTARIENLAAKFAARTDTHQRIQLNRQTRAALGVDIFTADRWLRPVVASFVAANVQLIKDIPAKTATAVEGLCTRAVQTGMLHGDLADKLEAQFGYSDTRAALIARDQVGKLYGQINAKRQQEAGISKFAWRTSEDERVRDSHAAIDGNVYSFDDPPTVDDEQVLPGEPILCRCNADPDFSDILDGASDDGGDPADDDSSQTDDE